MSTFLELIRVFRLTDVNLPKFKSLGYLPACVVQASLKLRVQGVLAKLRTYVADVEDKGIEASIRGLSVYFTLPPYFFWTFILLAED